MTEVILSDSPHPILARAIATTERRGLTLWDMGYTVEPVKGQPNILFVRRPTPRVDAKAGEVICGYYVDLTERICECTMYQRAGTCKHLIAFDVQAESDETAYSQWLAEQEMAADDVLAAQALVALADEDRKIARLLGTPAGPVEEPAVGRSVVYEVVEVCEVLGELPSHTFPTADEAWAWIRTEHEGARAAGDMVPHLTVREVVK